MNARERFVASMTFRPVDRCFLKPDGFSPLTIKRWEKEGLPAGCDPNAYFGMDPRAFVRVNMDCCPGFEEKILEDDGEYIVKISREGHTVKERNDDPLCAMPHFMDWPVKTREDFERIKEQYRPCLDRRYPPDYEAQKPFWNHQCDRPVAFELRGGFFHRLRMWLGLERLCMTMYDDPDWIHAMTAFLEEFLATVAEKVLAEVKLDYVYMCDDIAYKTAALISPAQFKEFFFEPTKRISERVHKAGVPVLVMDSDGNLDEFAGIYREAGFNTLIPIEVAAGNDLLAMRRKYGHALAFQGGFDKRLLTRGKEAIHAEVMRLFPRMMAEGGFTPNIDHAVPENVPFENYRYYTKITREIAENPEKYL